MDIADVFAIFIFVAVLIYFAKLLWKLWKSLKPSFLRGLRMAVKEVSIDRKSIEKSAWKMASDEVRDNKMDDALWAQAYAKANGDKEQQKVNYLNLRQKEIYEMLLREERNQ